MMPANNNEAPHSPSISEAFWYWLKLGLVSFGGPAGQIAIMHHDLVEKKRWISDKRFLHALNYCMLLPGPEAQQLAIYIGWLLHKTRGGLIAGVLFVLPSLLILIGLSYIYMQFGNLLIVIAILSGVKPAVVAIVAFAAYRIGARTLKNRALWAIACASFIAIAVFKLPFPLVIVCAALIGFLGQRYAAKFFNASAGHKLSSAEHVKAVIDDDTPTPEHAIFNQRGLYKVTIFGILVWCFAIFSLILFIGWDATLTKMAWFFTKAALLTFGGAYAVLPYVYQGAVTQFAWLTPAQMIDGLALGETTPGPLIMVVAFVWFVGGWTHHVADTPLLAAIVASCVVTFFTFLPSFVFIFLGAPFIESTKNNLKLTAPLTAITAAVVGVIASLAIFFAQHVFWQAGQINWLATLASLLGLFALVKWQVNTIKLIAVFAMLGVMQQWIS